MSSGGQLGIGLTEKLGYLFRKQATSTDYSCFPISKMVLTSAASLLQRDLAGFPHLTRWLVHPAQPAAPAWVSNEKPLPLPPGLLASSLQLRETAPQQLACTSLLRVPPSHPSARKFLCIPPTSAFPRIQAFHGSHVNASHSCEVAFWLAVAT